MTTSDAARPTRRILVRRAAVVLAALAILATGACGSDDDTEEGSGGGAAPALTADQEFSLLVADLFVAVARAGTDLCQLQSAVPEEPLEPATSPQATQSVSLRVDWLRAVADALPPGSEAHAQVLRDTATTLMTDAQTAGFPVEFWTGPTATATLASEPYGAAMLHFAALAAAQCPEDESVVIPG